MKVLFISALFPYPLSSGGHVRIYNLLKHLGSTHDITLFAYIRSDSERRYIPELEKYCANVKVFYRGKAWRPGYILRSATSRLPFLMATYENKVLSRAIAETTQNDTFDVIHAEPFYVSHVIPRSVETPLVAAEHNIEYEVYKKYAMRSRMIPVLFQTMMLDTRKLQIQEEDVWKRAKRIVCVSQDDRDVITKKTKRSDIGLVPNGVDTKYYTFHTRTTDPQKPKFLFVGNFLWLPNREAIRTLLTDIWPALRKKWPNAELSIVGSNIPENDRKLANDTGASVLGWVDDIRSVYKRSTLLVAPLGIGGGTKFKVLEAMASGLPVVTSKEGAAGLAVKDKNDILIAGTTQEYVEQCAEIIRNTDMRNRITANARRIIETLYSWDSLARELSTIWKSAV